MKKTNLLYISMTRKEQAAGLAYFVFHILLLPSVITAVLPGASAALQNFLFYCVNFLAAAVIFRKFWAETLRDVHGRGKQILLKAGLGFVISQVATVLLCDLFLPFFPEYFTYGSWGPQFTNSNDTSIAAMVQEHFLLMTIGTVLLVPPVEEVLYRGLIFGSIYPKSPFLACMISASVFSFIHMAGLIGNQDTAYTVLSFLQYLPAGLVLAWIYTSTDSIFTPILMHMAVNAAAILSLR